jgi:hypothetical protein
MCLATFVVGCHCKSMGCGLLVTALKVWCAYRTQLPVSQLLTAMNTQMLHMAFTYVCGHENQTLNARNLIKIAQGAEIN